MIVERETLKATLDPEIQREPTTVLVRSGIWNMQVVHSADVLFGDVYAIHLKWESRGGELRAHFGKSIKEDELLDASDPEDVWRRTVASMESRIADKLST